MDFLSAHYLLIKAMHILSFIAWMAGLLYLPRLFVYHTENQHNPDMARVFSVMERRLLRGIMLPSCIATFVCGGMLLFLPGVICWSMGWIHAKLMLVFALAGFHGYLVKCWRTLEAGDFQKTSRFFRCINEIPFIIAIAIVLLVVLKPF